MSSVQWLSKCGRTVEQGLRTCSLDWNTKSWTSKRLLWAWASLHSRPPDNRGVSRKNSSLSLFLLHQGETSKKERGERTKSCSEVRSGNVTTLMACWMHYPISCISSDTCRSFFLVAFRRVISESFCFVRARLLEGLRLKA